MHYMIMRYCKILSNKKTPTGYISPVRACCSLCNSMLNYMVLLNATSKLQSYLLRVIYNTDYKKSLHKHVDFRALISLKNWYMQ